MQSANTLLATKLAQIQEAAKERQQNPLSKSSEFTPEFGSCPTHGKYPLNVLGEDGSVRWTRGVCPSCARQQQVENLLGRAKFSARHRDCEFSNYENNGKNAHALASCEDYARKLEENLRNGRCLVLLGERGTGKNHLATAIAKAALMAGYSALKIKATEFLDEYWAKSFEERGPWMAKMAAIDFLFIDEIGKHSSGVAAHNALFSIIDSRYEGMKPTILLSNKSKEEVESIITPEGFDRLCEGGGILVRFTWESYRRGRQGE